MSTGMGRVALGLVLASCLSPSVHASTPSSATISFAQPVVMWSGAGLSGTVPLGTSLVCPVEQPACDDFALRVDRGPADASLLDVELMPSAGASIKLYLYPPSCPETSSTFFSMCAVDYGDHATLLGPANGTYHIRAVCASCPPGSAYSARAHLVGTAAQQVLGAAGHNHVDWTTTTLPLPPAGGPFGEPGIVVSRSGHIVVDDFGTTVWTSSDRGITWSSAHQVLSDACAPGDSDALIAPDDSIRVMGVCNQGVTVASSASTDLGRTWTADQGGAPQATLIDRPWYGVDPVNPGVVYMGYHDQSFLPLPVSDIWMLRSMDGGRTFTQRTLVAQSPTGAIAGAVNGNTLHRPMVDPLDPRIVSVVYTGNTTLLASTMPTSDDFDLTDVFLARSGDGGLTWTSTQLLDANRAFPSNGVDHNTVAHVFVPSALDAAGNIHIALSVRRGGATDTHVYYATVRRGSSELSAPVRVDRGAGSNVDPAITAGDPGRADIAWYTSPAASFTDSGAQWSVMFAQTLDGLDRQPVFRQDRVSGPLPVHVGTLCVDPPVCGNGQGPDYRLKDFLGIAADGCGAAHIAYADDASGTGLTKVASQVAGTGLVEKAACAGRVVGGVVGGVGGGAMAPGRTPNSGGASPAAVAAVATAPLVVAGAVVGRKRRRPPASPNAHVHPRREEAAGR